MDNTTLVTTVRRSGQLSANDPNYTSALILDEAQQAIIERFAEPVTALRQGYWLHTVTTTTDPSDTSGLYRLPPRAVVGGLEKMEISLDQGQTFYQLNILTHFQATGYERTQPGIPQAYTLNGDCVRLFPTPSAAYTLKFTYYLRPPTMIAYADVCRVTIVTSNVITVSSNPATVGITTSTGVDCQDADGSHEFGLVGATVSSITGVGPYVITLAAGTYTGRVGVGDYMLAPDTSMFPPLPKELHRPLADYVAAKILLSKGDMEKGGALAAASKNSIDRVVSMATPRIKAGGAFTWKRNSYLRSQRGWR